MRLHRLLCHLGAHIWGIASDEGWWDDPLGPVCGCCGAERPDQHPKPTVRYYSPPAPAIDWQAEIIKSATGPWPAAIVHLRSDPTTSTQPPT